MAYRSLDHAKILDTARFISQRIEKVFPQSGLRELSRELVTAAESCLTRATEIKKPNWKLRIWLGVGVLVLSALPLVVARFMNFAIRFSSFGEFMQATDAGFNVFILLAGAILFLVSHENRLNRTRALEALNELRSLAHIIDMHQLSKDPGIKPKLFIAERPARPRPPVIHSDGDLWLYLSFSVDLLAVVGKLAACFAVSATDRSVLDTVNEIEMLCTAISRKIWQKMGMVKMPGNEWMEDFTQRIAAAQPPTPVTSDPPPQT